MPLKSGSAKPPVPLLRLRSLYAARRSNWLFAGSLRAGQRAATVMSLIQSAKLNDHEPYRCLRDILEYRATIEHLATQPADRLEELRPTGRA
jgi:transposase